MSETTLGEEEALGLCLRAMFNEGEPQRVNLYTPEELRVCQELIAESSWDLHRVSGVWVTRIPNESLSIN
jgi:hypothetical protein